ncbi:ribosomal protein S18-alanine N-acetyltransferase [Thermosyntropha sp.]|uniref:ribosomal protein S18-alanine N-acetyltransferase n=1 Tax=Thermosyntropha sp. TaxID=2740820 RepID=UPI0025DD04C9|nr:ribosomal protein S18-alanine N-acetyltransferase [Thermosyntropha sp.]MBO8158257.1 ribosomal protein S18-alanine N-acetyltransferase [Thermosyntropha sp.]
MENLPFIIRKMTERDIDEVVRIEQESFPVPWSKEAYLGELKNNFAVYLVCDYEGEIAGYGGMWIVFEEAHITNIAVDKRFRGKGMGRSLLEELERIAREKNALRIVLEVRPSNHVARNLYKSVGFVETSIRKGYYSNNGEDAIVMTKLLF